MKYRIHEIAKMLNISSQLLRYYEQNGLIAPSRDENGYRYYTPEDINRLIGILRYKNMGFSLSECKALMYSCSLEETIAKQSRQYNLYAWNLLKQQCILETSLERLKEWEMYREGKWKEVFVQSPDILRITLNTPQKSNKEIINLMPVSFICPLLDLEHAEEIDWGFAIEKQYLDRLGLPVLQAYEHISGSVSLSFVAETMGNTYLSKEMFLQRKEELEKHGYHVKGKIWGQTIGNYLDDKQVHHRLHRFYMPIETISD